jgi:pimeloyl-ACP methyl ester carboxylesterase
MAEYVLVHGAWGGAHVWRKVRPPLWAAGHHVWTPPLTGLGERYHLASPQVDLTTHVADVVNHVAYEDLQDIVLVGFSYGGMVVTGSLAYIADRVRHLVYVDAFVPGDGQSLDDLVGLVRPGGRVGLGAKWQVEGGPRPTVDEPGAQAEAEWNAARYTPQPSGTLSEKARLERPLEEYPFTRTYIKATAQPRPAGAAAFWAAADHARSTPGWRYAEIVSDHGIPLRRPEELVDRLLELA